MTIASKQTTLPLTFLEKLKKLFSKEQNKQIKDENNDKEIDLPSENKQTPRLSDYIAGEISDFKDELSPFLPVELVAGEVPYISGMEYETVWNAAAQACATEKVNFSYAVDLVNDKVAYLACPSTSLASAPDSWCPLVAALPGNPEFIDKETVYVYEQDASTAALRWNEETKRIQLFIGASRTIIPKIQSMDTNFVTIGKDNPHVIGWKNQQLKTEKLARALIRTLLFTGVAISIILITILLIESFSLFFAQRDLTAITKETKETSRKLIENSYKVMHSDVIMHSMRMQKLLDETHKIDGFLFKYEVSRGKVMWEAFIPQEYVTSKGKAMGGTPVEEASRTDGLVRIRGTK